ncbi:transmembrane protein 53 [Ditylenchus destructor]|uniref:Transmembrane protein 53 n=1 Tax=Ditylenchus destructor TaxID=166010 RepID=A0AAD4R3B3_9BILA|nr:transmembrane protein 53 [Ditylenchus destructor]
MLRLSAQWDSFSHRKRQLWLWAGPALFQRRISGTMPITDEPITVKWSENKEAPLVLLFGWAGCRDRYLSKYAKIYEENGCSTLRFTVPISKVRCYSSYKRFAAEVYEKALRERVIESSETKFPIYVHVFSMNGCSLFSALWDLLENVVNGHYVKNSVKGIVFDSSPADVMPWQGATAVSFATFPPPHFGQLSRTSYRYALTAIFSMHRAMVWLRSHFNCDIYAEHFSFYHLIKFDDLPRRQLYLYSAADVLCSAHSIEHFQDVQRQLGHQVTSKKWENSPHVEHLRHHAEEYSRNCKEFVSNSEQPTSPKTAKEKTMSENSKANGVSVSDSVAESDGNNEA